ncbi:MAG TPA: hypothetical protein VG733_13745 [Chthoniobacteraceae bacterium]|nr:hypothetical protein [Chthoniobacteraceae bacterium]
MNLNAFLISHLVGLAAVALGTGGMLAGDKDRRTFAIIQGLGLLVMILTGFAMLPMLGYKFPPFAIVKLVLWVAIGMLPVIFRKKKTPLLVSILILLALIGCAAWLGVTKPALW